MNIKQYYWGILQGKLPALSNTTTEIINRQFDTNYTVREVAEIIMY